MKISIGNDKLGKRIATISREVGPTCLSSCFFLGNGCYAERLQNFRPSVKAAWTVNNVAMDLAGAIEQLRKWYAKGKIVALRLHVGGDFLMSDKLDRPYLAAILRLLRAVKIPAWVYTHAIDAVAPHVRSLRLAGCQVFASCHNDRDTARARLFGYRVAFISTVTKKQAEVSGERFDADHAAIACPEQIGTKKSCEDCGFCFREIRNHSNGVTFYKH